MTQTTFEESPRIKGTPKFRPVSAQPVKVVQRFAVKEQAKIYQTNDATQTILDQSSSKKKGVTESSANYASSSKSQRERYV